MANSQPVKIEILMVDKLSSNMEKSQRKVKELKQNVATANKELENTERISDRLTRSVGKLAGAFAIKELVANATQVRGHFQQLEVDFTTMLQSGEKADALLQQLTKTAATTPFGLEDVAQGAKQLLAYGLGAEKVNETLIRLGDIAAGLSVPLNDLVYLYGTTMAQGRLYTQDLNQFTGRGIPMISELAKQFGVAESKVKELVESGKVGFPEVQKVIESLTNEGGKFGGLMEEQSKNITGQISNIEDSISVMFNELGQQSEGIINSTLSGISYVTEHYERFGRILLGLVSTYGTYRTAIMLVTAAKGWATAAEALHYNWLLLVEKAQKMLNSTMLANPYVLVATLISGVVVAMVSMKTEAERMKEADEAYENQKQKVIEAEEAHKRRLEELAGVAGDEALSTDTRREALNKLEQKYPDIFAKYDTEIEKLQHIKKIKEEIAALEGQKSITRPENEVKDVNKRIAELEKKGAATYSAQSTIWGSYTYQNGGRTKDEEAELQSLYRRRDVLKGKIRKNSVNSYFENLTGVSNETLEQQIKQRENLLARMMTNEKKYGTITQGDSNLRGTYSRDELQFKDVELLNWLVEKGYAKPTSISVWEAQSEQLSQLEQDLKSEKAVYDELWNNLQGSDAHWEWGNSLNGGSVTHSLRGMSAEQIELYYNQEKLSDAARDYYEAWVDSGKTVEELVQNIEECYSTMREMVMGVSFDSFLSNAKDALKEMRSDISKLGEFTEDTLAEAVLNAFMYHDLSKVLQPLYNELSEAFIGGTADKDYLSDWRERFEKAMQEAGERLDAMADASGIDLDSGGTSQSGKSGAFTSMSQEQAGKLEGLFVSGQMHWSSMDDKLTDVTRQMDEAGDHLRQIATNTGSSAQSLVEIKEDIKKMIRDGLKVK